MKKLLLISILLITLSACELKQDWNVTTTTRVVERSVYTGLTISDNSSTSREVVLDMSEAEIKAYCEPKSYSETYGSSRYTYYISRTYSEIK